MKLLLHMCCAPCSTYPVQLLREEGIEVEGIFYNPNIHPIDEYNHRLETVKQYAQEVGLKVHYIDGFQQELWENFNGERADRCKMCYKIRLDVVAKFAKESGYDAFSTTLLISPYQQHELLNELGIEAGKREDVPFYYRDFRPGFRQGQTIAREMGLYRQKYCGCIKSKTYE